MTKKHFIAMADQLRRRRSTTSKQKFQLLLDFSIEFCRSQNPRFSESIFRGYVLGECGPSGGKVR